MKKMLQFALITITFLLPGCKHRIGQPPKAVLHTFDKMFPGATHYEVPASVMTTARKFCNRKIDDVYLFEQSNGAAAYYTVKYKQKTPFSTKQIHILTDGTILV